MILKLSIFTAYFFNHHTTRIIVRMPSGKTTRKNITGCSMIRNNITPNRNTNHISLISFCFKQVRTRYQTHCARSSGQAVSASMISISTLNSNSSPLLKLRRPHTALCCVLTRARFLSATLSPTTSNGSRVSIRRCRFRKPDLKRGTPPGTATTRS